MFHLEITLSIPTAHRNAAVDVYQRYRAPFLEQVAGARSKQLLVRDEDVQVLHAFDTEEHARAYLRSTLFTADIVSALAPLLSGTPDVRVYRAFD